MQLANHSAKHFDRGNGWKSRSRVILLVIFAIIALAATVFGFVLPYYLNASSSLNSDASDGNAKVQQKSGKSFAGLSAPSSIPFDLDGIDANAPVVDVSEGGTAVLLDHSWKCGGNYQNIAAAPIDSSHVFGSNTDDPNDEIHYYPALISSNGTTKLADPENDETGFWEPQDGTGTDERIVWKSSKIGYEASSGTDTWRIQTWDKTTGNVKTLADSISLNNGSSDTPITPGEVGPTFNDREAYYAGFVRNGAGAYKLSVIGMPFNGSENPMIIAEGSYPAAVDDGVIFAVSSHHGKEASRYSAVAFKGTDSKKVKNTFSIVDRGSKRYGISGIWACGSNRVVSFTSKNASKGSYILVSTDSFKSVAVWLHVKSPSVVASLNNDWLVWGSGSQASNNGMYAYNWKTSQVKFLGNAEGYSRPSIARSSNTVLVPQFNGYDQAVSFVIGILK